MLPSCDDSGNVAGAFYVRVTVALLLCCDDELFLPVRDSLLTGTRSGVLSGEGSGALSGGLLDSRAEALIYP